LIIYKGSKLPVFQAAWLFIIAAFIGLITDNASMALAEEVVTPSAESITVHEVRIPKGADKFEPSVLKIKVGDTVKWINEDDRGHPVASIPGQGTNDKELFSPSIAPGGAWSHTFKKAGEYPYFCYIHYVMMGVVIVEEAEQQPRKTE
jgi:plastocyanin